MIESVCLTDIPFDLDIPALLKTLHIDGRPEYAERCTRLAQQAVAVGHPKALYGLSSVESTGEDSVAVDGIALTSRVLRVNLDKLHRAFPFVITCGVELAEWSRSIGDMLERFWVDAKMEAALRNALDALHRDLAQRYAIGHTGMMNPGSLEDWPVEQQGNLFRILGDAGGQIGVTLTERFIMVPVKSASGLLFQTQAKYENCQMCPRDACPNRRAPYEPELYASRYAATGHAM